MNTVADKLMKLVQTKSDIRQALLDKGFNVPDTMPFSGYADLIRRFPCNAKDFPDIPGMIARWSAKGLTNEDMSTNPVWKDLMGNGYDLQMKNFGWAGMSGVNGYVENYNGGRWVRSTNRADMTWTSYSVNITSVKIASTQLYYQSYPEQPSFIVSSYMIRVQGLKDGQTLFYRHQVSGEQNIYRIIEDGIYTLPSFLFKANGDWYGFQFNKVQESCNITIEQLPLYPGALVFDGVDDYGICENFPILTKEKGYTVVALRQWMETTNKVSGVVSNALTWFTDGAFVLEYRNINSGYENTPVSFGRINPNAPLTKSAFTYQTSLEYNGVKINTGTYKGVSRLTVGSVIKNNYLFKGAIWEIVILDHDATEEELQKIQDYYKQEYPWLFFDQAWTVTGKTNEDTDRATIANITGNGNNLVLSNFGFAENSGYGLYGENYLKWYISPSRVEATGTNKSFNITSIKELNISLYYQSASVEAAKTIPSYTIKVTGLTDGQELKYMNLQTPIYNITSDGLYKLPSFGFVGAGSFYGFNFSKLQESCDITIEQIPEYEGYLVTDGVDDEIQSSNFSMGKDFTVVGEWKMLKNSDTYELAGINKYDSFILYNYSYNNRINAYIHSGQGTPINTDSIKAFTSTGLIYIDDFNNVEEVMPRDKIDRGYSLFIGYNNNVFTKLAFKNLAIYSEVLSKEDCIKAYNYLQTLKS